MSIDLERVRRDTPGCAQVLHFNNAGASLMPRPVLDALIGHLQLEARIGGYEAADRVAPAIDHVYDALARLLNCRRDEVAFLENATRAWDMAFYAFRFARGDRILTGMAEYASNYIAFLQVAGRTGAVVEPIPNDAHGQISVEALRRAIDDRVKLIALTHVPTNGGLVNPAAAVGRVARHAQIPYLLDACQSVGQMPIDVEAIGCDILSATGRKFLRGPRATGFLYVSRAMLDRLEPPFLDVHAATWVAPDRYEMRPDARRFENWETHVAGKLALGVAVDYALALGLGAIRDRVVALAELLRERLRETPGVSVHDLGTERCGIVTFAAGVDAASVKAQLARQRINVTTSSRRSTLLDMDARGLTMVVRASVHYYNSEDEVDRFVRAVAALR
jgi:cysteine desulfurase/selenocysteine lyase